MRTGSHFSAGGDFPRLFIIYWVYILQSQSIRRFYCGHTGNLENRIRQHHDPTGRLTLTTKRFPGPWQLVWQRFRRR
ncbi:MAG: GIY-YIG nuclease family protein [Acidobacteria bacterium]|nr:GIY-YIG nuclease family protein [Acidobacteriota bacterium]